MCSGESKFEESKEFLILRMCNVYWGNQIKIIQKKILVLQMCTGETKLE